MTLQAHEIPVVTILDDMMHRTRGISSSVIYEVSSDSTDFVFMDLSTYAIENIVLVDTIIEHIISNIKPSYTELEITTVIEDLKELSLNVLEELWSVLKNYGHENFEVKLFISSYLQTLLDDTITSYRVNIGTIPTIYDTDVEMYICGTNFFNVNTTVFCAAEPYYPILPIDVQQALGRVTNIPVDLFSVGQQQLNCITDIFSANIQEQFLRTDLIAQPGRLQPINTDIFSTRLGLNGGIVSDFKTRSLFIGDFFIEQDTFTTASSIAWVDIVDFLYPIATDSTYLEVDATLASGVWFENIPNGKRLFYNPMNDFYSNGVITYFLHAESSIGEVEDRTFYLLYGYDIEPNEVLDWGPNKVIVVRAEAQNMSFCPNKESVAFDFTTADLSSYNLNCTIRPVGYVDLPVSIFPQSTVFYYGNTYTICIRGVKDFSGNIMPDFEYSFTIESP